VRPERPVADRGCASSDRLNADDVAKKKSSRRRKAAPAPTHMAAPIPAAARRPEPLNHRSLHAAPNARTDAAAAIRSSPLTARSKSLALAHPGRGS
jgi:hypothetical protein